MEENSSSEFVISSFTDIFFENNMFSNFGELGFNIKELLEKVAEKK